MVSGVVIGGVIVVENEFPKGGATIFLYLLTRVGIGVLLLRFCGSGPAGGRLKVFASWGSDRKSVV